jgi:hypothetical protein
MPDSSRLSGAQNPETISSGELTNILGWLRSLPSEELSALIQALAHHDSANLAGYFARFRNWFKSSN